MNPVVSPTLPSSESPKPKSRRERIGVPLAIALFLLVLLMGKPAELSVVGHRALALFSGIFILYLTEAIPLAITSIMIVPAAVLLGITNTKGALSGFGSTSVYLMFGAFILAVAMVKSRLAERITYLIMRVVGDSATSITFGLTVSNIILAFLVPSTTARTAILLPVCMSIIKVFGVEGRSNFAAGVLLLLSFTNSTIAAGIMTATVPNPVTVEFISKAGGPVISYLQWFIYGFPPALLMTFITWWYIMRVFKPEVERIPQGKAYIETKLAEMGSLCGDEKRALLVFTLVVVLWATGGWTKIDPTIACLAGISLLFLPKIGFLTWGEANKGVSWRILLMTGGGISLGDALTETGAAKWLAVTIFKTLGLEGLSVMVTLIIIMFIVQYMHIFFVGATPMATGLIPIVIGMAGVLDVNPVVLALPAGMLIGGYPLLMFYNTSPSILIYGTGKLTVGDFPRVGFALCAMACVVYAVCAMTYWRWLGLY
ncbi:MAG: DASS family sodium-coupled anion symporter [Negativicutes bacterium]|nr:DASS family sodium-coupled anion symporter [Negativicutes bacterium]